MGSYLIGKDLAMLQQELQRLHIRVAQLEEIVLKSEESDDKAE